MASALEVIHATQRHPCQASRSLWETCEAGERVFARPASGVPHKRRLRRFIAAVVLKGPLSTPVGKAKKSANVTLRKVLKPTGT